MQEPLHIRLARLWDVGDIRLSYGITGPLLAAIALIAAFMYVGEWWLLPAALFVVVVLTAVVLIGIAQMLSDSGDSDDAHTA